MFSTSAGIGSDFVLLNAGINVQYRLLQSLLLKLKKARVGLGESNYSSCNNCWCYSGVLKTFMRSEFLHVSISSC